MANETIPPHYWDAVRTLMKARVHLMLAQQRYRLMASRLRGLLDALKISQI